MKIRAAMLTMTFAVFAATTGRAAPTVPAATATRTPGTAATTDWRISGHLHERDRDYHYVVTFTRLVLPGATSVAAHANAWRARDLFIAGFELTGDDPHVFVAEQRYARPAAAEAGFAAAPLDLRVAGWRVRAQPRGNATILSVHGDRVAFDLTLNGRMKFVAESAHHTRAIGLRTSGTIAIDGRRHELHGLSAVERIADDGSNAPGADWSWFDLQLDDGRYIAIDERRDASDRVRSVNGLVHAKGGRVARLSEANADVSPWGRCGWSSPQSGARYPTVWDIAVPDERVTVVLQATVREAEVVPQIGGEPFWEGAADVIDAATDTHIGWAIVTMHGIRPHALACGG